MIQQRWLRIIPVALIMYTISYVDRTNVSLALDPKISSMMRDLLMDDRMKGQAAGIFFLGYVLLQISGGHLAGSWSAKKLVSLCLIFWGVCAVGCGLAKTFHQFEVDAVFSGRGGEQRFSRHAGFAGALVSQRRNGRGPMPFGTFASRWPWSASAPFTGWLLGAYGWQTMLILEGALPFIWLPDLVVFHQRPSARRQMDFGGGKEFFGNHPAARSGATGAAVKPFRSGNGSRGGRFW